MGVARIGYEGRVERLKTRKTGPFLLAPLFRNARHSLWRSHQVGPRSQLMYRVSVPSRRQPADRRAECSGEIRAGRDGNDVRPSEIHDPHYALRIDDRGIVSIV
ncbi:hypothetical protein WN55_04249 [Dufourea novaeangliae]|uniref:Uncharacterized protein n=1 Tax=Dufourea novaeangliae TaxID=178035 RepID=A0A154NW59_DUFNO|nr:hypothetical protein WN55_04249 [Dufourea novaeangliae]